MFEVTDTPQETMELPKFSEVNDTAMQPADVPRMSFEDMRAEMQSFISDTNRWVPETRDISPSAYEFGLEECRDIARETFTRELFSEWYNMSSKEREDVITEYGRRYAQAMGIQFAGLVFDVTAQGVLGENRGDGYVHLAEFLVRDPGQIVGLIDTVSHELRHQFQWEAFHDPERFGIDAQTAREWQLAWEVYYSTDPVSYYDPIAYKYNPCETDARHAGESIAQAVVRSWYKGITA